MALEESEQSSFELTRSFDLVNAFRQNFYCSEVKNIISLFKQVNNVWQHPLILNYSHCLICKETVNSPYSTYSLQQRHLKESPHLFLRTHKIRYRLISEKLRRIKRRMVKSQDNALLRSTIDKKFNSKYEEVSSDTDILFVPSITSPPKKKKKLHFAKRNTADASFPINEKEIVHFNNHISEKRMTKLAPLTREEKSIITQGQKRSRYSTKPKENKATSKAKSLMKIFKIISGNTSPRPSDEAITKHVKVNDIILSVDENINSKNSLNSNNLICCDICLQEIKEKFVLGCGDFYCRDCIRKVVLTAIHNISLFNKLVCPKEICKEKIEERVIEKLLTNEEFTHYSKLKTRVDGLRTKSLIPCPYPDCEQFGSEKEVQKNLLYCGNNHLFCVKCLKEIPSEESIKQEHMCSKRQDESVRYLEANKFIKKCPNCSTWGQREPGGCNNMTCINPWCNIEFCWICEGTYEASHYKNPFSVCFGLVESDYKSNLSKYKSIRVLKCIVIFIMLLFVVLPIVVNLFSFVLVCLYIMTFVFDGSAMKNIKIENDFCRTIFNVLVYLLYLSLSIAIIPLGYIVLGAIIVIMPILIIFNKIKKFKDEDDYS